VTLSHPLLLFPAKPLPSFGSHIRNDHFFRLPESVIQRNVSVTNSSPQDFLIDFGFFAGRGKPLRDPNLFWQNTMQKALRLSIPALAASVCCLSTGNSSFCDSASAKMKRKVDCADTVCQSKTEMFRAAMQSLPKQSTSHATSSTSSHSECPVDREELGFQTWSLLHTLAAYFPENPSAAEQSYAHMLLVSLARLYPCHICAEDFQTFVANRPPKTDSREEFVLWTCELHNSVNSKLGKSLHPCSMKKLEERWRIGTRACIEKQSHVGDGLN